MPHSLYDAVLGALALKQVTNVDFSANGEPLEGIVSGGIDVAEYFGGPADFRASFDTEDLASVAAVSNIATAGLAVASGTITIPWQKRADLSTFASGSNHYTLSGTNALIVPSRFDLPAQDNASASLECVFVSSDGDTVPVGVNVSQALASQSFVGLYGLGPVSVNGTVLTEVLGATITPGIRLDARMYEKNYARNVHIIARRPVIEIRTYDLPGLSALGPAWGVGTACVVYARRRSGVSWALDAATSHVKFSFADGIIKPVAGLSGAGNGDGTRTLRFFGESLVVTGSSAIT
jgi:hypothetical protein